MIWRYSGSSKEGCTHCETQTLHNQLCNLRRKYEDEINDELHRNFSEIAPRVLNIISDIA